jgi:hypothetical protein
MFLSTVLVSLFHATSLYTPYPDDNPEDNRYKIIRMTTTFSSQVNNTSRRVKRDDIKSRMCLLKFVDCIVK